jgi:taurine dioxygenase
VVVFRDQNLNIDGFEGFAQCLGCFGDTPFITPVEGHPNVLRVLRKHDEEGPLFGSGWHSDWSFQSAPPTAILPYAVAATTKGGDTAYTNQYLTFDTLSDSMQTLLDGLNAVHAAKRSYGLAELSSDQARTPQWTCAVMKLPC